MPQQFRVEKTRSGLVATASFDDIKGVPVVSSILAGFRGLLTLNKLALVDYHEPLIEYQHRFDSAVDVTVRAFVRKTRW